jgi:hypothetical protein
MKKSDIFFGISGRGIYNKMIIAIHQPNYLPYLGFFDKMKKSDIFVIYDDAQFNSRDFQHRNRIRTNEEWQWLTVPTEKIPIPINEIKIKNNVIWSSVHFTAIRANYLKTPHYSTYDEDLRKIYKKRYEKLIDLNMDLIYFFMGAFGISTKIIYASDLGFTSKSTERLLEITDALGGDVYLSGPQGGAYMDVSLFEKKGIKVEFQDFKHPTYKQRYGGFIPNMSAIDALFNVGEMPKVEQ